MWVFVESNQSVKLFQKYQNEMLARKGKEKKFCNTSPTPPFLRRLVFGYTRSSAKLPIGCELADENCRPQQ